MAEFSPELYVAFGRVGYKAYLPQIMMYELLMNGYKLDPMNEDELEPELWPKENPYIKKEKKMDNYIFDTRERDELLRDLEDAEERNNVKDAEIDNLRVEIADMKKKLTKKFAECKDLGQRIHDLDTLMSNKNERIRADHEKIADLNKTIKNMTSQVENQAETISNQRDEIKALKTKVAFLNGMCSGAEVLTKENSDLKVAYKRRIEELDKVYSERNSLRDEIEKRDNLIHRYEIMRQTLQMIFGVNIDI